MLENLKKEVLKANLELEKYALEVGGCGGLSAYESRYGLVVARPDGVSCENLKANDLIVIDIDGNVIEGELPVSRGTKTHLEIYKAFPGVSSVAGIYSPYALAWAQAKRDIPCYGTMHAEHFCGAIVCTRSLTKDEIFEDFEKNAGKSVAEVFKSRALDPLAVPAVLCAGHAPFAWGKTVKEAAANAVALENAAKAAVITEKANPAATPVPNELLKAYFKNRA